GWATGSDRGSRRESDRAFRAGRAVSSRCGESGIRSLRGVLQVPARSRRLVKPSTPCGRREAPPSSLADVEARDQAILDPEDMADDLVNQHRSLEVAHCLVDLDDGLALGAG